MHDGSSQGFGMNSSMNENCTGAVIGEIDDSEGWGSEMLAQVEAGNDNGSDHICIASNHTEAIP